MAFTSWRTEMQGTLQDIRDKGLEKVERTIQTAGSAAIAARMAASICVKRAQLSGEGSALAARSITLFSAERGSRRRD